MTRHAIVTGSNKGIGFEICKQLASNGVFVVLTARNEKLGNDALQKLKELGLSNVVFHQLDVTDRASLASFVKYIETNLGKLDILVNNSGASGVTVIDDEALKDSQIPIGQVNNSGVTRVTVIDDEAIKDLQIPMRQLPKPHLIRESYEEIQHCIEVNYFGTKAVTEALLPILRASPSPKIVNLTSTFGQLKNIPNQKIREELSNDRLKTGRIDELVEQFLGDFREGNLKANGWPEIVSAYKVSKSAVNAYTRVLAKELPSFHVNCVHPGFVRTDMNNMCGIISPEEGARGPVMLALMDEGPSGLYFDQMEVSSF